MAVPRVLTIRELRNNLASVIDDATAGKWIYAGSHRKPEIVIMSVEQLQQLTTAQVQAGSNDPSTTSTQVTP